MQQFVVPQFIDVEDKIIGAVTVRQFIILLVGGGLNFIAYKLADFALFAVEGIIITAVCLIIAFVKINGRPIHYFFLNVFQTLTRKKLRVWLKKYSPEELRAYLKIEEVKLPPQIRTKNRVRASRLAEMSLIVDTGGIYQGESEPDSTNLI